jgi:GNAT superfamily N-acetyltransferase
MSYKIKYGFKGTGHLQYPQENFYRLLAFDKDGKEIGRVAYHVDDSTIDHLEVDWDYRHKGIGTELIKRIEKKAKLFGKKVLNVEIGTDWGHNYEGVKNFLEDNGFEIEIDPSGYKGTIKGSKKI